MTIPPTLTPRDASSLTWDVVVIGAGPAGTIAARELARQGGQVLLVEKSRWPRFKVCGGCLSAGSLAHLSAVGLGTLPRSIGAVPFDQLVWVAGRHQARIKLPGGVSVSRECLDAELTRAAIAQGVQFLPAIRARVMDCGPSSRLVELVGEGCDCTVAARIVLDASGLAAKVSQHVRDERIAAHSHIGAGVVMDGREADYPAGCIYMACARGGYVGLVRVEDHKLNVAAALAPDLVRRCGGLGNAAMRVLLEAGLPRPPAVQHWKGTPLLTRRATAVAAQRMFLLGDAAGYIEPFTGEGMNWALTAARAVVPLVHRGVRRWTVDLAEQWQHTYRRLVSRRQWVCRLTTRLLRAPTLTQAIVRCLAAYPGLARPLVRPCTAATSEMDVAIQLPLHVYPPGMKARVTTRCKRR